MQVAFTFETLIVHNKRISAVLILCIAFLVAALSGVVALALSEAGPEMMTDVLLHGITVGIGLSFLGATLTYFCGGTIVAGLCGARRIQPFEDKLLYNVVEEMALAAGLPTPDVYIIYDETPNAFASGRDPEHALIAITTGLRKKLDRDELQAVVAHEMGHIKNYDILTMMFVAVFAGIIVLISDFFLRSYLHGLHVQIRKRRTGSLLNFKKGLWYTVGTIFAALILSWMAPTIALLLQLAISREREYLADATAVQLCRNPIALANALRKIALDPGSLGCDNRATEAMFIVNPNPVRRTTHYRDESMWATHPPVIKRIAKLRALAHDYPDAMTKLVEIEEPTELEFVLESTPRSAPSV